MKKATTINEISFGIRGAAFKVHSALGPGLFESVYEKALEIELQAKEFEIKSQVVLPVIYKGLNLDAGFRLDILVNDEVIVEIKSVESLSEIHFKQLTTYLKLTNKKLGLLINFNSISLIDKVSFFRIVNNI